MSKFKLTVVKIEYIRSIGRQLSAIVIADNVSVSFGFQGTSNRHHPIFAGHDIDVTKTFPIAVRNVQEWDAATPDKVFFGDGSITVDPTKDTPQVSGPIGVFLEEKGGAGKSKGKTAYLNFYVQALVTVECSGTIQKIVDAATGQEGPGFVDFEVTKEVTLKAVTDSQCTLDKITWEVTDPSGQTTVKRQKGDTLQLSLTQHGLYTIEASCGKSRVSYELCACKLELDSPKVGAPPFPMDMAGPTMPKVTLQLKDPCPGAEAVQFQCRFVVGNNGKALEYEDAPSAGYVHPGPIDSDWLAAGKFAWDIDWGNDIYGGHITKLTVSLQANGKQISSKEIKRDIWIVGGAVTQGMLSDYLDSISGDANLKKMTKAIAKTETGTTNYWPGTGLGTAHHNRYPLRERLQDGSAGSGYGMMQLTSANLLNRNSIWNWKVNVSTGIARIKTALHTAANTLAAHPATDNQIRLEAYAAYNGGSYNVWQNNQWIEDPGWVCGGKCSPRKGRKVVNGQPTGDCVAIGQCYANVVKANEY